MSKDILPDSIEAFCRIPATIHIPWESRLWLHVSRIRGKDQTWLDWDGASFTAEIFGCEFFHHVDNDCGFVAENGAYSVL